MCPLGEQQRGPTRPVFVGDGAATSNFDRLREGDGGDLVVPGDEPDVVHYDKVLPGYICLTLRAEVAVQRVSERELSAPVQSQIVASVRSTQRLPILGMPENRDGRS